jgi:hypothetical protein
MQMAEEYDKLAQQVEDFLMEAHRGAFRHDGNLVAFFNDGKSWNDAEVRYLKEMSDTASKLTCVGEGQVNDGYTRVIVFAYTDVSTPDGLLAALVDDVWAAYRFAAVHREEADPAAANPTCIAFGEAIQRPIAARVLADHWPPGPKPSSN